MKPWTSTMTLIVAGSMLAGSAFAQTTTPSGAKDSPAGAPGKSDTMKSDSMKSDPAMKSGRGAGMAGAKTEHVKAVQQALKDKGHDPGMIDGKMGPQTQSALREFQSKEGLEASGRLDADTMSKLGVEAGAAARGSSTPSASPSGTTGSGAGSTSSPSSGSGSSSTGTGATSGSGAGSGSGTSSGGGTGTK
jgi:peptidoglycan hydrolase-like protein with peptidoglycan-binding domain